MSHFHNLLKHTPDLRKRRILDVGSGKGDFLIDAVYEGADVVGVEINTEYIQISKKRAREAGISLNLVKGTGEDIPFRDKSFDFVNASELIEHVQDPRKVFSEIHRVLETNGFVYVSVPNRFGIRDPHFKLYFVNWVPRGWANTFISIFGEHKDYLASTSGLQSLTEMHYFTFRSATLFFKQLGFETEDIRAQRIVREHSFLVSVCALVLYCLLRPWYFDTFHFLLKRKTT